MIALDVYRRNWQDNGITAIASSWRLALILRRLAMH